METKEEFQSRFTGLCERLGGDAVKAGAWFEALWDNYEEPGRAYHTITFHIAHALDALDYVIVPNKNLVEFALWFHDVVYDGRLKDNEERSAKLGRFAARNIGVRDAERFGDAVFALIMETVHDGVPKEGDLLIERQWICDIDLKGLGGSQEAFDEAGERIRKEYAFATDEQYAEGRKAFARAMLARPSIFSSAEYQWLYELQAKKNLMRLAGRGQ